MGLVWGRLDPKNRRSPVRKPAGFENPTIHFQTHLTPKGSPAPRNAVQHRITRSGQGSGKPSADAVHTRFGLGPRDFTGKRRNLFRSRPPALLAAGYYVMPRCVFIIFCVDGSKRHPAHRKCEKMEVHTLSHYVLTPISL